MAVADRRLVAVAAICGSTLLLMQVPCGLRLPPAWLLLPLLPLLHLLHLAGARALTA